MAGSGAWGHGGLAVGREVLLRLRRDVNFHRATRFLRVAPRVPPRRRAALITPHTRHACLASRVTKRTLFDYGARCRPGVAPSQAAARARGAAGPPWSSCRPAGLRMKCEGRPSTHGMEVCEACRRDGTGLRRTVEACPVPRAEVCGAVNVAWGMPSACEAAAATAEAGAMAASLCVLPVVPYG